MPVHDEIHGSAGPHQQSFKFLRRMPHKIEVIKIDVKNRNLALKFSIRDDRTQTAPPFLFDSRPTGTLARFSRFPGNILPPGRKRFRADFSLGVALRAPGETARLPIMVHYPKFRAEVSPERRPAGRPA